MPRASGADRDRRELRPQEDLGGHGVWGQATRPSSFQGEARSQRG